MIKYALALCLVLVAAVQSPAATVTGHLQDCLTSTYTPDKVRFVPRSTPMAYGNSTVLDIPRSVPVVNGDFTAVLFGGKYDVDFGAPNKIIPIYAMPGDNNTYTFNELANLAANAFMFAYTNAWNLPSSRVRPSGAITVTTNNAGTIYESVVIGGGGSGNALTNNNAGNVTLAAGLSVTGLTTNTGAFLLNGSGSVMNRIAPYSAPNYSGFSFYGTNYASGNALSDWMDFTTNGLDVLQWPVLARNGLTVSNNGTATGPALVVSEQGRVISVTNSGTGANSLLLSVKSAQPFQIALNPHSAQSNRATLTLTSDTSWNGQARASLTADGDINFRPNNFAALTLNDTNSIFGTNVTTLGSFNGNGVGLTNIIGVIARDQSVNMNRLTKWHNRLYTATGPQRHLHITDLTNLPGGGTGWLSLVDSTFGRTGGMTPYGGSTGDYQLDVSGGVTLANDATIWPDTDGGIYTLHNTDTMTFHRRSGLTGITDTNFLCDTFTALYVKEPGAGSFKIQKNIAGAGWVDVATVNAVNGTIIGAASAQTATLAYNSWRLLGTSGNVRVKTGMTWDSTSINGVCIGNIALNGASFREFNACSSAVVLPWLQAMDPHIVFIKDTDGVETPSQFGDKENYLTNGCPNASVVWIGQHMVVPDSGAVAAFNAQWRTNALLYDQAFWDASFAFGTNTAEHLALSYVTVSDNVHPTTRGTDYINGKLWDALSGSFQDIVGTVKATGVRVNPFNTASRDNVGIGTAATTSKFVVQATRNGSADLFVFDSMANNQPAIAFATPMTTSNYKLADAGNGGTIINISGPYMLFASLGVAKSAMYSSGGWDFHNIGIGDPGAGNIVFGNNISLGGSLSATNIGSGFKIKTGTNARLGTSTLTAGAVTVANTSVTANSRIFVTSNTDGGTPGWLRVSAKSVGTSFTITSSSGTDTSTVVWLIVESIP